jgi:hypothetical protein
MAGASGIARRFDGPLLSIVPVTTPSARPIAKRRPSALIAHGADSEVSTLNFVLTSALRHAQASMFMAHGQESIRLVPSVWTSR